ncbi:ABC transporter permease [Virgisporangium aliadipatigenens]|uniref:ABC transporter permease n=1 Tax=Virgisporangium aliadipatigenens TaxID=741659 RepID=A0A8J3YMQ2_9ACTN|nr:hypothetical protein [Virgisporangium aliadipatigenens]GIJ48091.1 ABC transporter permease [Virgisporangium aliadipatigenens]
MTLIALTLRRHRVALGSWWVLLVALSGVTVPSYRATYPTAAQRLVAADLARRNVAGTLLYGRLGGGGTSAELFAWEVGAIVTVLAAVAAVLLAVALTRAAEDDGTVEVIRSNGVSARAPLYAALAVLAMFATACGAGCAAVVGMHAGRVDGVTAAGAVTFGATVGLTFLVVAVLAVLLAQVVPAAGAARLLGLGAVGIAFAVRAVADVRHVDGLNRFSPLGLRAVARPFDGDRWGMLGAYLAVAFAVAGAAVFLHGRRDFRGGLLRQRDRRAAHLRIRSTVGLAGRLARGGIVAWTLAVAAVGTLFSAMGSGVLEQSRGGDVGGFLGAQLGADPVAGYFAYTATVLGVLVSAFAVLSVARTAAEELSGRTDHVLATGVRRWAPLAARVVVTAAGAAAVLLVAGLLSGFVAARVIDGADVAARAFGYVVGQWPAVLVAAGWTALLAGWRPRFTWLAWVPLVLSAGLALLGQLLGVPERVRDLGTFHHVPDLLGDHPHLGGQAVLLAVAAGTTLAGLVAVTRRDVTTG